LPRFLEKFGVFYCGAVLWAELDDFRKEAEIMTKFVLRLMVIAFLAMITGQALAWQDNTHVAIARAAGYEYWFNAAGADLAKTKAGNQEEKNHYFDNLKGDTVDVNMVLDQANLYDLPADKDKEGHLYGAIIASIRKHDELFNKGEYVGYHMAFAAHYIGDLSMPNHNMPLIKDGYPENDKKGREWHIANDGVLESIVLKQPEEITKRMYIIILKDHQFEADLAAEIARIANLSRVFGEKLRAEKRIMTTEEAFGRIGHSASLLKAVLEYYNRKK
jgi:hypothetical protein